VQKAERGRGRQRGGHALTVSVAGQRLAIPANDVAEVIRHPAVTRLPLSPRGLIGVANLRGTVIPIVSLATLLGEDKADASSLRVVVVGTDRPVGLTVDDVSSLEQSDRLRSGENPVRFIDVDALMATHFGAVSKPAALDSGALAAARVAEASSAAPTEAFFSFDVAGQEFALPLGSVREVLALPDAIAVVPRTDDAMLGAVTLRNHLLPLVSLSSLLGLSSSGTGSAKVVVALIKGIHVGLVVDALKAIVRVTLDQIDPVPLILTRGRQEAQIQAICRLDEGRRLMSILSADHLLEDGLTERLAAGSDKEDELMADSGTHARTEQFVVFQLGSEHYGLPIGSVVEVVVKPETLTKLPKAPKFVEGVMNLRGQIVPVIDQRRRFEAPARSAAKARIIVVRIGTGLAGFVVDNVSEVLRVDENQLRPSPDLASRQSKVIDRVANLELDGRMILLIDPQELLDQAEQDMIVAMHGTASAPS